jgi:DNA-binding response OmpR family regulator
MSRIFIVDDDHEMVEMMATLLDAAGHRVKSNLVGAYAIPQILEMRPQAVLLDLVMGGIDGYAMAAELRAQPILVQTKLIMVSGRSDKMWTDKAREAGFTGFIAKPIDLARFVSQVEALIAQ